VDRDEVLVCFRASGLSVSAVRQSGILICITNAGNADFSGERVAVNDFQASLEQLRQDAAEAALIRDLATDMDKRKVFDRINQHFNRLGDEVEQAMKSYKTK
jgi:hypothetical protein